MKNISLSIALAVAAILLSQAAESSTSLPVQVRNALDVRNVPDTALSIYVQDVVTGDVVLAWNDAEPPQSGVG